jgi:flagellar export protein FliJ
MKKFRFTLNALLGYREHLENMAKQDLAQVLSEINRVNEWIGILESEHDKVRDELQARSESGITALDMSMYMDYLAGIEQKSMDLKGHLETLNQRSDEKRRVLAQKSVEKKAIVNLKEKRKAEYVKETEAFLQQQSDEMVLLAGLYGPGKDDLPTDGEV